MSFSQIIDRNIHCLPESIDYNDFIVATYYSRTPKKIDIFKYVEEIAIEQTTGALIPIPGDTPKIRKKFGGRVVNILEVPPFDMKVPEDQLERTVIIQIAFPLKNIGSQIPMLLTTIIGTVANLENIKLIDIQFPESFMENFRGPKFGIEGIRSILGVSDRPLLNSVIKPSLGFDAKTGSKFLYDVAIGGADIIKDDELLADPIYCRRVDRVKEYMKAVKRVYEETGRTVLYTVNVTDTPSKVIENALKAIDAGANAIMINYLTAGIGLLADLSNHPDIKVPILAHTDFGGAIFGSPYAGISANLLLGKLPRIAGADIVVYPSTYGKFNLLKESHLKIGIALTSKLYDIKKSWPTPGGGVHPGSITPLYNEFGKDFIVVCGGTIHGHPMGPTAGAKAFRQAIDALVQGRSILEAAKQHEELKVALEKWGLLDESGKTNIIEIK